MLILDGNIGLQFYSTDNAGNDSNTGVVTTQYILVDKTIPTSSENYPATRITTTSNQLDFNISMNDSFSGIASCDVNIYKTGTLFLSPTTTTNLTSYCSIHLAAESGDFYVATFLIKDVAGNTATFTTSDYQITTSGGTSDDSGSNGNDNEVSSLTNLDQNQNNDLNIVDQNEVIDINNSDQNVSTYQQGDFVFGKFNVSDYLRHNLLVTFLVVGIIVLFAIYGRK